MRYSILTFLSASLLAFAAGCQPAAAPEASAPEAAENMAPPPNTLSSSEAAAGWRLLFDGQTLNGWEQATSSDPNAAPDWSAQDGTLLCGGSAPSWIHTNDVFSDGG